MNCRKISKGFQSQLRRIAEIFLQGIFLKLALLEVCKWNLRSLSRRFRFKKIKTIFVSTFTWPGPRIFPHFWKSEQIVGSFYPKAKWRKDFCILTFESSNGQKFNNITKLWGPLWTRPGRKGGKLGKWESSLSLNFTSKKFSPAKRTKIRIFF